jgi:hypothetical protein
MGSNAVSTDFLFAQPSYLSGMARLIDLTGLFDTYNGSQDENHADMFAMFADWRMTGQDIGQAMEIIEQESR